MNNMVVEGGSKTLDELRSMPHIEISPISVRLIRTREKVHLLGVRSGLRNESDSTDLPFHNQRITFRPL